MFVIPDEIKNKLLPYQHDHVAGLGATSRLKT